MLALTALVDELEIFWSFTILSNVLCTRWECVMMIREYPFTFMYSAFGQCPNSDWNTHTHTHTHTHTPYRSRHERVGSPTQS